MISYTKRELTDILRDQFYVYKKIHSETLYEPEEGVWQCPLCYDEYPDHDYGCHNEKNYGAVEDFITLLKETER